MKQRRELVKERARCGLRKAEIAIIAHFLPFFLSLMSCVTACFAELSV